MYYYFATTLPMISFDGTMPFSVEDFAADCACLLSERDYQDARIALGLDEGRAHNAMLATWQEFDQALRNERVWVRAADKARGQREFHAEITPIIAQASKMDNLLEAEKLLMHLQWQKLDEWTLNKDFALDYILAYGIKLKMLARLNAFKTDEGAKMLEGIVEEATSQKT